MPVLSDFDGGFVVEVGEAGGDGIANGTDGALVVAVRAADRLFDDLIDDAEHDEVLRRDLHRGRGFLALG